MYLFPYFNKQKLRPLQNEIREKGFKKDIYLSVDPACSVYGINLAFGWPLPSEYKKTYEELAYKLQKIEPNTYIYPYSQTHITVLTIVNFKAHLDPSVEELRELRKINTDIIEQLADMFENLKLKPFIIDVGPPILSRKAAFLPILNETGQVLMIRKRAVDRLSKLRKQHADDSDIKKYLPETIKFPNIIHSTFLRFSKRPSNEKAFLEMFEKTVSNFKFGKAKIKELFLTSETKPYMRSGEIIHRFKLKE